MPDKKNMDKQNREVLERNIEESKKLIEEREAQEAKSRLTEGGEDQVPRPAKDDPRHANPMTTPGQENVPAGGTSGMGQDWAGKRANRRG